MTLSSCPSAEVLSALFDGEITPEERARVEAHVALCAACADALGLHAAASRLLGALPRAAAPEALVRRVVAAARTDAKRSRRAGAWRTWAAAASVVAGAFVITWAMRVQDRQAPPAAAALGQTARAPEAAVADGPSPASPAPPAAAGPAPVAKREAGNEEAAGTRLAAKGDQAFARIPPPEQPVGGTMGQTAAGAPSSADVDGVGAGGWLETEADATDSRRERAEGFAAPAETEVGSVAGRDLRQQAERARSTLAAPAAAPAAPSWRADELRETKKADLPPCDPAQVQLPGWTRSLATVGEAESAPVSSPVVLVADIDVAGRVTVRELTGDEPSRLALAGALARLPPQAATCGGAPHALRVVVRYRPTEAGWRGEVLSPAR